MNLQQQVAQCTILIIASINRYFMADNKKNRMGKTKVSVLKALISFVKKQQFEVTFKELREFLVLSTGDAPHPNNLSESIYNLEQEGFVVTARKIAPGCKRRIVITVHLTPEGVEKITTLIGTKDGN